MHLCTAIQGLELKYPAQISNQCGNKVRSAFVLVSYHDHHTFKALEQNTLTMVTLIFANFLVIKEGTRIHAIFNG